LLILAGITINLTIGDGGIIKTAQQAGKNYVEAAENEQNQLAEFWNETEEIVSGVYWVSVGSGDKVPVPTGFYYVGGNLSTGVVISDNSADEYDGKTNKVTWDYAPNLKGNQFVWIPCNVDDYAKDTTFVVANGNSANMTDFDTSISSEEKTQIEKYGGFYVGRYEAGTSEIKGISFDTITTTGWFTDATNYSKVTSGNITSKANEIPWYHTDYTTALKMSKKMYENNYYVSSSLITGTQWDVMIKVMNQKTSCSLTDSDWGNYYNKEWTITRGLYCEVGSAGAHDAWVTVNSSYTKSGSSSDSRVIFSTASNSNFEKYNIYDVAGNLWELTQEVAYRSSSTEVFVMGRGGSYHDFTGGRPASYRGYYGTTSTYTNLGFRVVLYMK
jgi:hypothetical protein